MENQTRSEPEALESVQSGPDVDKVRPIDRPGRPDTTNQHGEHAQRRPERDERGRL